MTTTMLYREEYDPAGNTGYFWVNEVDKRGHEQIVIPRTPLDSVQVEEVMRRLGKNHQQVRKLMEAGTLAVA